MAKGFTAVMFHHHDVQLHMSHHFMFRLWGFTLLPLCYHCLTHPCTVDQLEPLEMLFYTRRKLFYCLYAPTWIDIVSNEPWPTTTSRLPDDHALRTEHLPPPRELRHSSVHRAGHLRLLHPIDRLSYNWIWNLCNNLLPEIRTSTSWPPRSQATSLRKHMTAFSRPSRWSTRTTPAVILFQTWKLWWRIQSCNGGRYTCKPPTSTWW